MYPITSQITRPITLPINDYGAGPTPPGGYTIAKSLRFRSSASAYLNRTFGTPTNTYKFTFSFWMKRGVLSAQENFLGSNTYPNYMVLSVGASDQLQFVYGGTSAYGGYTAAVFRDPSAWYHIVFSVDTTQATDSNRVKIYVNGVQQTSITTIPGVTATYPPQNTANPINSSGMVNEIAATNYTGTNTQFFDGYMAEINFIDGQALTPSSFGAFDATSGVWQPVKYSGTYGTNGFYLKFSDTTSTTTLCYDYSGNGNNWTPNNISLTAGSTYDSMLDSPTNYDNGGNGVGNYAVGNPLLGNGSTFADGNLAWTANTSSGPAIGTIQLPTTGKWYWEITPTNVNDMIIGIQSSNNFAYAAKTGYYRQGGASNSIYIEGSVQSYNAASYTNNDVIAVAYNADSSQITWYKNNTQQGGPFTLTSLTNLFAIVIQASGGGSCTGAANFGQRPFAYTPPTGFKALNTQNLPAASIVNGASYMAATLYTGNGSTQSINNAVNGVSFQPDFVWGKLRTTSSYHRLSDSVRGASLTLATNVTDAEVSGNGLVSFDATGFSMNSSTNINQVYPYVAWQWKAGGTAVSNTAGSITSQVSANTTSGFSVVTWTGNATAGATIGHGLGAVPGLVIIKNRSTTTSWPVWHSVMSTGNYLYLNTADQIYTDTGVFNSAPTSSVIVLGSYNVSNGSGNSMVAYCFAAIPGYSAFGSYTGNGSADGPFVFCGFRPRFVLIKCSSTTDQWIIHDTARDPYNISNYMLFPNLSDGGYTYDGTNTSYPFDMLSNGFKLRNAYPNSSGGTYIYAAFAENPFKYSLAR